jgi:hypothetical protein
VECCPLPRREQNLNANPYTDSEVLVRPSITKQSRMDNPMRTAKFCFPSSCNNCTKCFAGDIRCFTHAIPSVFLAFEEQNMSNDRGANFMS